MPNWVKNEIVIKGPKATLEAIKERAKAWVALPKDMSLEDAIRAEHPFAADIYIQRQIEVFENAQTRTEGRFVLYRSDEFGDFSFNQFVQQQVDDPNYQTAKKNHCANDIRNLDFDWYRWNIDHWGCKWDAGNTKVKWDGDDLVVSFDTPWGPPEKFLEQFARMYPDIKLECFYFEEQGQFAKQKFCDDMKSSVEWSWIITPEKREDLAKELLSGLATNVENIFDIVNLDTFIQEAWFEIEDVDRVRDYETASGRIYEDEPKQILNLLNASTDNGKWFFDEETEKYIYAK